MVVVWRSLPISAAGWPQGSPLQHPLHPLQKWYLSVIVLKVRYRSLSHWRRMFVKTCLLRYRPNWIHSFVKTCLLWCPPIVSFFLTSETRVVITCLCLCLLTPLALSLSLSLSLSPQKVGATAGRSAECVMAKGASRRRSRHHPK
jgi:hypothetical protein